MIISAQDYNNLLQDLVAAIKARNVEVETSCNVTKDALIKSSDYDEELFNNQNLLKYYQYPISSNDLPARSKKIKKLYYDEIKQVLDDFNYGHPCAECIGICTTTCLNACYSGCTGACKGGCNGAGDGVCSDCSGACVSCTGWLGIVSPIPCGSCFRWNCSGGCSRGCNGGCSNGCSGRCQSECKTLCLNNCSASCGEGCAEMARIGTMM